MIYTITFNPALDYVIKLSDLRAGEINRTEEEAIFIGGKGLNVSRILNNLEIENTALGFIAGFTGEKIKEQLELYGIKTNFIKVKNGMTRINVKIRANVETAINGNGPKITDEDINKLLEKINNIKSDDIVVLSGNVPKNVNPEIYATICEILKKKNALFIVDATKDLLIKSLKYSPFLIKPNREELSETLNIEIKTDEDIIKCAKEIQKMGARNVLISLGGKGAMLVTENDDVYNMRAPEGKRINTVGAGDSMIAGFIAGYLKNNNFEDALKTGIAAGSATACSIDLATKDEINTFLQKI